MEKDKANNRILKAIGMIVLSGFCLFLGLCLCLGYTPLKEAKQQINTLSYDFYCGFEKLRGLGRLSEMDADHIKSLEFQLDRLCYVLDLYEYNFPPVFGEELSPEQARTIRQYLSQVLDRLGDVDPGQLRLEDEQYFADVWGAINRMLDMPVFGTPGPFEWLSDKITEENLI